MAKMLCTYYMDAPYPRKQPIANRYYIIVDNRCYILVANKYYIIVDNLYYTLVANRYYIIVDNLYYILVARLFRV